MSTEPVQIRLQQGKGLPWGSTPGPELPFDSRQTDGESSGVEQQALPAAPIQGAFQPIGPGIGSIPAPHIQIQESMEGTSPPPRLHHLDIACCTHSPCGEQQVVLDRNLGRCHAKFHSDAGASGMEGLEDMEEPDAKRLRRKLNNRESARRSRQKKADEITRLQELVTQKDAELDQCKRSVSLLQMHVQSLVAKVSKLGGSVNEPGILQALHHAPAEPQPPTTVPAGTARMPPEAQTAVNVLGGVAQQGRQG